MLHGLFALLVVLTGLLVIAYNRRERSYQQAAIPRGTRVLAVDLGAKRGRGPLLRDGEWGLVGRTDALLQTREGEVIPVDDKRAWPGYQPGKARPSHLLQLGAEMLLVSADPQVRSSPSRGVLRYRDSRGNVIPGGEVRVENTVQLRTRVLQVVADIRGALASGVEQHRSHSTYKKCFRCVHARHCGETLSAPVTGPRDRLGEALDDVILAAEIGPTEDRPMLPEAARLASEWGHRPPICASEVGDYCYCARSWWLRRRGLRPTSAALLAGNQMHGRTGIELLRVIWLTRVCKALVWASVTVTAVTLLAFVLGSAH